MVPSGRSTVGTAARRSRPTLRANVRAEWAGVGIGGRVAVIGAVRHHPHRRQKPGEGAHGSRFAGAAITHHEYAADPRIDRREQQAELHLGLADDGAEGVDAARGRAPGRRPKPVRRAGEHLAHAARRSWKADQTSPSDRARCAMSASVCSGDGVRRRRSVPFGTVGKLIGCT